MPTSNVCMTTDSYVGWILNESPAFAPSHTIKIPQAYSILRSSEAVFDAAGAETVCAEIRNAAEAVRCSSSVYVVHTNNTSELRREKTKELLGKQCRGR